MAVRSIRSKPDCIHRDGWINRAWDNAAGIAGSGPRGDFCTIIGTGGPKCQQGLHRCHIATSAEWNFRYRSGFALAGAESKACSRAVIRRGRAAYPREAGRRNIATRKAPTAECSAAGPSETSDPGIEAKTLFVEKTARSGAGLMADQSKLFRF
jgi:hypothetical protein